MKWLATSLRALLMALTLGVLTPAYANDNSRAWDRWTAELKRQCPSHHVDWTCDGCWTQLTGAYEDRLRPKQLKAVTKVADIRRQCANERAGFGCEMVRSLVAYDKLHLMRAFTAYGCRVVKCEEPALCSRFPDHPA